MLYDANGAIEILQQNDILESINNAPVSRELYIFLSQFFSQIVDYKIDSSTKKYVMEQFLESDFLKRLDTNIIGELDEDYGTLKKEQLLEFANSTIYLFTYLITTFTKRIDKIPVKRFQYMISSIFKGIFRKDRKTFSE